METNDQTKLLAELSELLFSKKVAQNDYSNEILSNVLMRLDKLENQIAANQLFIEKPALHPSQRKFEIAEANETFLPNTNEKACRFEPDKPCDYCSMCSAQGF